MVQDVVYGSVTGIYKHIDVSSPNAQNKEAEKSTTHARRRCLRRSVETRMQAHIAYKYHSLAIAR